MRRPFSLSLCLGFLALAIPAQAAASQTLTVEKEGSGTGTVTSAPAGIACGAECNAPFANDATVVLIGAPATGSEAPTWSGCDAVNGEGKCEVTMSEAREVKADFELAQHELKVIKEGNSTGSIKSFPAGIECGKACSAPFPHGTLVTLTATPAVHTLAPKWSGCGFVDAEDRCMVTMSQAREVKASFSLSEPLLKVTLTGTGKGSVKSAPAGIECGSSCSAKYLEGTTITLSSTPSGEAEAPIWSGCDSVTAENKCVVTLSTAASREVGATFNLPVLGLSVIEVGTGTGVVTSAPTGIECGATCAASFIEGSSVTLKAAPGLHTEPVQWTGCDKITFKGECIVTMSAARAVIANFALEPQWLEFTITVQRKGNGQGTVESSPGGILCGEDCSEIYLHYSQITLTAEAAPGSEFLEWVGGGCKGQSGPCATTVQKSSLIKAIFVAVGTRTLTVAKSGSGQGTVRSTNVAGIECGSVCSAEFDPKAKVTLSATAVAGSTFAGWSGEGCSGTKACHVQMNEARNVTATFTANPTPPGPKERCRVPRLIGKTLAKARNALAAANCTLGRVRRPKGAKPRALRVRSSSPAAGSVLAAHGKVNLRLARVKAGG